MDGPETGLPPSSARVSAYSRIDDFVVDQMGSIPSTTTGGLYPMNSTALKSTDAAAPPIP